ncbi:MAG: catalase HPII [Methylobacter sp.]|nr:catalase HPII [Methylobacter sp.]
MNTKNGNNSLKGALNKIESLEPFRSQIGESLTTNQGVRIADNQNSLKGGTRGPTLLEDFILREKITHFDHERIPERVVHARGEAAHGYFQVYEPMAQYTKAKFLQDPAIKTPVFVRFSTVAGSRGSADTARDVRGFAVKFYTEEGNYDLVGNNIPVFFIQDAIKFPDLIHAAKPEPNNEIPQAATAHDTFWDFISKTPEAMHMIMWIMSDRAIPRSHRMMEGFGVNTFRLINADGKASFVKFHWKPLLGVHSLVWEEAQQLAGKDADFHRRDLWEAIEAGDYPEWELGVQIIDEADEFKFDFDILDATKLIPEELVPVKRIGKLTLNRNPDNFFAETEQVAFHPGHLVPGIDFSNDPLLQGRLFSYLDTQLIRLGGPNFHELPINRPICPFHNNQRDGFGRQTIVRGRVAYEPNTLADGFPKEVPPERGGFASYPEKINDSKIRIRSESFGDHYSQATLFWNSQSEPEKKHIVSALQFELGKVEEPLIRERLVSMLNEVDEQLAAQVAAGLGIKTIAPMEPAVAKKKGSMEASPALSMAHIVKNEIKTRKIAILAAESVDAEAVLNMKSALENAGAKTKVIGSNLGTLSDGSKTIAVDHTLVSMPSAVFDAVFIPGSKHSVDLLMASDDALQFVSDAYKHGKAIATTAEGQEFLLKLGINTEKTSIPPGVIIADETGALSSVAEDFITAIASHRHWDRPVLATLQGSPNSIRAALQRDD